MGTHRVQICSKDIESNLVFFLGVVMHLPVACSNERVANTNPKRYVAKTVEMFVQLTEGYITSFACSDAGVGRSCKEVYHNERSSSKKRVHDEVGAGPQSKACREKLRRDRLNDRFLELCSALDPGGTPKSDKVAILSDAARALNHLRAEAQKLKDANLTLRESIKNLKAEKVELREEKVRLKAEKERIEQTIKSTSMPSTIHPATAYHAAALAENTKAVVYPNYSPVAMWQWIHPAVLDTSHDHVLRPPVA